MDAESQVRKVGLPPLAAAYTSEKFQEEVSRRRFKKNIQKKIPGKEGRLNPASRLHMEEDSR